MEENREVVKETSPSGNRQVVQEHTDTTTSADKNKGARQARLFIYYLLGVVEVLLAFRFVFKLLGANPTGFVSFIYGVSGVFLAPFTGIFRRATTEGIETASVLEPETLIAMAVYAVAAWGIAKLLDIATSDRSKA